MKKRVSNTMLSFLWTLFAVGIVALFIQLSLSTPGSSFGSVTGLTTIDQKIGTGVSILWNLGFVFFIGLVIVIVKRRNERIGQ